MLRDLLTSAAITLMVILSLNIIMHVVIALATQSL